MRVVVTGATGNVETAVTRALHAAGHDVVGVARRRPAVRPTTMAFQPADVRVDDLAPVLAGADAVVHLAWASQPAHDPALMHTTNVLGTSRVLDAAVRAGVPTRRVLVVDRDLRGRGGNRARR